MLCWQFKSLTLSNSIFFLIISTFLIVCLNCQKSSQSKSNSKIVLWAWERPENLEFLDTEKFSVAFLAQTLVLEDDKVNFIPRRQPLKVARNTFLIAVTRIETNKTKKVTLSETQKNELISFIKKSLELPNVSAIQIDFDAAVSEREFYRQLLTSLRQELPPNIPLTMTALASWCAADNWLHDLPVDEAVPMAFEMGADNKTIREFLSTGKDWQEPLCRQSYGISINEPLKIEFKPNRRFYIFNPNPRGWQESDLKRLPEGVKP